MGVETALAIGVPLAISAIGAMVQSGGRSDVSEAAAQKMGNMQKSANTYGAYRQDSSDARMKAMQQQLSSFQGAGNIMNAMYGGKGGSPSMGSYTPGQGGYSLPDGSRTPTDPRTGGPVPKNEYPINPHTGKPYTQSEWDQKRAFDDWVNQQKKDGTYGSGPIIGTPSGDPSNGSGPPIIVNPNPTHFAGPLPGSPGSSPSFAGPPPGAGAGTNPMIAQLASAIQNKSKVA
jgi:hypothetical protein